MRITFRRYTAGWRRKLGWAGRKYKTDKWSGDFSWNHSVSLQHCSLENWINESMSGVVTCLSSHGCFSLAADVRCGSQKKNSGLPWKLCNVYYCYNSPSLKGSDVWTVAPVVLGSPSPGLIMMQSRPGQARPSRRLFILPSPPPPWEYYQPDLIMPTSM